MPPLLLRLLPQQPQAQDRQGEEEIPEKAVAETAETTETTEAFAVANQTSPLQTSPLRSTSDTEIHRDHNSLETVLS